MFDVIIVAGQSNAAGAGFGSYRDTFAKPQIDARILHLGRLGDNNLKLLPVRAGINDGLEHWNFQPNKKAIGFGLSFARRYIAAMANHERQVVILPAALGGASINDWLGEASLSPRSEPAPPLLTDLIMRAKHLVEGNPSARISALLWHQGESDAVHVLSSTLSHNWRMSPVSYCQKLVKLLRILREELPGGRDVPMIGGTFVPTWRLWRNDVAADRVISEMTESIKFAFALIGGTVVSAEGLKSSYEIGAADRLHEPHFCAGSQVELGMRYFEAWKDLTKLKSEFGV